jgi:hypothetical protein
MSILTRIKSELNFQSDFSFNSHFWKFFFSFAKKRILSKKPQFADIMPQFSDKSDQVTDKCFLWLLRVNNEKGFFTSF